MTIEEIRKELAALSGGQYASFSKALNPTSLPMLGVRLPDLRKLAKKIAGEDYKKFLDENPMDNFEMETLQAMVIGYAKDDLTEILKRAKTFIPKIHDWSVNDSFCQTFKIAEKFPEECWDFFMQFAGSKKEFEVRVVAVMLMSHFLKEDYIDKVIKVLDSLYTGETVEKNDFYYAKMGVAWALATIAAKFPDKCLTYMKSKSNHLDSWTFNKSIQKMNESYRVSANLKEKMSALKK